MKPIAFKIIKKEHTSIHVQENIKPFQYNRLHYHPEYQISLVIKGKGEVQIGNGKTPFQSEDLFLIAPDVSHVFKNDPVYFQMPQGGRSHMLSVFFLESTFGARFFQLPEMQQIKHLLKEASQGIKFPISVSLKVKPLLFELTQCTGAKRIINVLTLLHQMATSKEWIKIAPGSHNLPNYSETYDAMKRVLSHISRNFDQNITLTEAAQVANLSKYAFCRYFQRQTHKSFITYLNEFRVSMACKYLSDKKYSVSQIGFMAGYNTLSNFYRQFKRVMKCTPVEYREGRKMP